MKTLEKGKDKIQHICQVLKEETLKPAQDEAEKIIARAKKERDEILKGAGKNADKMLEAARECIEREKIVFKY